MVEGMQDHCEAALRLRELELKGRAGRMANNGLAGGVVGVDKPDVAGLHGREAWGGGHEELGH